jgi:cytochrome c peroxidase
MKKGIIAAIGICFILFTSSCGPEIAPEIISGENPEETDTTLIPISSELPEAVFPSDNMPTAEAIDLGRHLFYDNILSANNEQSCGSCHNQELAFTDNNKRFSEGTFGDMGDRNAMPLFNLMWSEKLFWDSRANDLRHLALMPIENPIEMASEIEDVIAKLNASAMYKQKFKEAYGVDSITDELLAMALEQFLFSLVSDNSKFDKFNRGEVNLSQVEMRGFNVLKIKGCFNCHNTGLMHDNGSHNTGLDRNPKDKGLGGTTGNPEDDFKMKTPSLRNIMVTAPYMHDGRFATVEDVIRFYEEDVNFESRNLDRELMSIATRNRLTSQEMSDALAFLRTLTDHEFLKNPKHSDPF